MSNLIILFIALTLNNGAWMFVYLYSKGRDDEREEKRLREFVLATQSRTVEEYVQTLPSDEPLITPVVDEVQELSEADPGALLKAIKQEHGN